MDLKKHTLVTKSNAHITSEQFWMALQIWNNRPHIVNRRLCGVTLLFVGKLIQEYETSHLCHLIQRSKISVNMTCSEILSILQSFGIEVQKIDDQALVGNSTEIYLTVKKLLPRNQEHFQPNLEVVILDKLHLKATFIDLEQDNSVPVLSPRFPYGIEFNEGEISLVVYGSGCEKDKSALWLKKHLFPKLVKWAETATTQNRLPSLVPIDRYNTLYQELKKKYGQEMVKIWPENTDPLKFVYEDVAIATYLLLLWEIQRDERNTEVKQSFVDLGCGNGLLVHILSSEGYQGVGLDVRKRRIWDLYPSTTQLQIQSITPSDEFLFPETDWLIGNHSDELTPWIPVIAARSSYNCSFFLLPCCPFEFDGSKYQRHNASRSQYGDYIEYVQSICEISGFIFNMDKLRIPSTKRICLVGAHRKHPIEATDDVNNSIRTFIEQRCNRTTKDSVDLMSDECSKYPVSESSEWCSEFKPRESEEKVRNCTLLDKSLVEQIIDIVTKLILSKHRTIINSGKDGEEKLWNAGGLVALRDVASTIPGEMLKQLKSECGGLQTLLKNNHHIFRVANGEVQFRVPVCEDHFKSVIVQGSRKQKKSREIRWKQRPCWFFHNHPDGCLLQDSDCSFKH